MSQMIKDLGAADSSLNRWRQEYGQQGDRAFVGSGHQQPEEEKLRQFCKKNEILHHEPDILFAPPIKMDQLQKILGLPLYCVMSGRTLATASWLDFRCLECQE